MLSVTASVVPGPGTSPVVPPACGLQAWIWGSRDMKSRRGPFVFARWQPCLLGVAVTARGTLGDTHPADRNGTGREQEAAGQ